MLHSFQLTAIVGRATQRRIFNVPLRQDLQRELARSWQTQVDEFLTDMLEVEFNAGYQPEGHELFAIQDFQLPEWLVGEDSQSAHALEAIPNDVAALGSITGVVAFARTGGGDEIVMFQNFNRSHIIRPGRSLFLQNGTYASTDRPGLTLGSKLSAVYLPKTKKLLFDNFRTVNTFLPLTDYYEEASEEQIRDVLAHKLLAPEDVDGTSRGANQWMRKRFAMLRDSGVLDEFSARTIQTRGKRCNVSIRLSGGKIVFPADKAEGKKVLQFLNEELYRGAISDRLFETNSKRVAD